MHLVALNFIHYTKLACLARVLLIQQQLAALTFLGQDQV